MTEKKTQNDPSKSIIAMAFGVLPLHQHRRISSLGDLSDAAKVKSLVLTMSTIIRLACAAIRSYLWDPVCIVYLLALPIANFCFLLLGRMLRTTLHTCFLHKVGGKQVGNSFTSFSGLPTSLPLNPTYVVNNTVLVHIIILPTPFAGVSSRSRSFSLLCSVAVLLRCCI